jgi:hypothetical protein
MTRDLNSGLKLQATTKNRPQPHDDGSLTSPNHAPFTMAKKGTRTHSPLNRAQVMLTKPPKSQIPHHRCAAHLHGAHGLLQDPDPAAHTSAAEHAEIRSCR